jgi:hypothetical protein
MPISMDYHGPAAFQTAARLSKPEPVKRGIPHGRRATSACLPLTPIEFGLLSSPPIGLWQRLPETETVGTSWVIKQHLPKLTLASVEGLSQVPQQQ